MFLFESGMFLFGNYLFLFEGDIMTNNFRLFSLVMVTGATYGGACGKWLLVVSYSLPGLVPSPSPVFVRPLAICHLTCRPVGNRRAEEQWTHSRDQDHADIEADCC